MKDFNVKAIEVKTREAKAVTALLPGKSGSIFVGLTAYLDCLAEINPRNDGDG